MALEIAVRVDQKILEIAVKVERGMALEIEVRVDQEILEIEVRVDQGMVLNQDQLILILLPRQGD
jgi:hypothetical protein